MPPRSLVLLLLLFGLAPATRGAHAVSLTIRRFGLEGIYDPRGEPTWVRIEVRNTTSGSLSFHLRVAEVDLQNGALPVTEVSILPVTLAPGEARLADLPVRVFPREHAVIYAEARNSNVAPLGRAAVRVGSQTEGQVVAMLCAMPEVCREIRQSILLSGSADEQSRKSQTLRLIQLSEAPPVGWAYAPASTVVLATPVAVLSQEQRDALEIFLRRGGVLVLAESQLGDALTGRAELPSFLGAYRWRIPEGRVLHVGDGQLLRFESVSSSDFSNYFRSFGATANPQDEIRRAMQFLPRGLAAGEADQLNSWLMMRLGTVFRLPSFLELLFWIIGYLLLVGAVNFIVLRRIGRPEWAWISIPALAVLFSVLLYEVSARNHPRNFGVDEMTVYRLDNLSPFAILDSRVRISAPSRSVVRPVLPGNLVQTWGQGRFRNVVMAGEAVAFTVGRNLGEPREVQLGATWETSMPLRRWSFQDLNFEGYHRFAGTIYRDSVGRVHNETGVNYEQAIVVDSENVFLLDRFPAGAVADLAHVPRYSYDQETGHRTYNGVASYPQPPFEFHHPEREEAISEAEAKRFNEELKALRLQSFSLLELIRGWSKHGSDVFSQTKAVLFGLSREATVGASLRDHSPDRKFYSLTIVAFEEWP